MRMNMWGDWEFTTADCRPGAKGSNCDICGWLITRERNVSWKQVKIAVREKRVNQFRGDDLVEFAHSECAKAPVHT